jgi:hypothetical protein
MFSSYRIPGVVVWYRCLSPLTLWVRIPLRWGVLDTILCDAVYQWFTAGRWFSQGTLVSSTNKTDLHDITEILLKVALNTITLTPIQFKILQTSISAINVIRLFLSPWYLYTCTCTFFVCQYYQQFFLTFRKFCKVYNDFIKIRKNKCFCLTNNYSYYGAY